MNPFEIPRTEGRTGSKRATKAEEKVESCDKKVLDGYVRREGEGRHAFQGGRGKKNGRIKSWMLWWSMEKRKLSYVVFLSLFVQFTDERIT
jgi:hypothetical protein